MAVLLISVRLALRIVPSSDRLFFDRETVQRVPERKTRELETAIPPAKSPISALMSTTAALAVESKNMSKTVSVILDEIDGKDVGSA